MASVEKRVRDGQVRWRAHYRTAEGKQRNRSFDRKTDAERFLTSVEASKLAGTFVDPHRARVTVGEQAETWLASKVNLKPSTRARYNAAQEDHVLPRWDSVTLGQVEHDAVQDWVGGLVASGAAPASVRKVHGVLAAVLEAAVRARRLAANPARDVTLPRAGAGRRKYLDAAQVEAMAAAAGTKPADRPRRRGDAPREQYRLVVLVLAYCGLRWSELAGLGVSSFDPVRRRLTVSRAVVEVNGGRLAWGTPKSHEARWVPVEPMLADELAAHAQSLNADALLFTAPSGEVLRNRNARRDWFNRAAAEAGAPGLTPHELRHTAASLAIAAGANVKAVQRMLGHASAAITLDAYADLFPDDLEAVGTALSGVRARAGVARTLPKLPRQDPGEAG